MCNLFWNIATKRVEKRCCALYHPGIKPQLKQIWLMQVVSSFTFSWKVTAERKAKRDARAGKGGALPLAWPFSHSWINCSWVKLRSKTTIIDVTVRARVLPHFPSSVYWLFFRRLRNGRSGSTSRDESVRDSWGTIIDKSVGKVALFTSSFSSSPRPWPNVDQNVNVCARNCSVISQHWIGGTGDI